MKHTNCFKKMAALAGLFCFGLSILCCPATTITANAATDTSIVQPNSDIIEWRYKIENGKLYKRLYNASTGNWVGDWIFVCDYPPTN